MSATAGGPEGTATQNAGDRLGLKTGMVVQELGWDEDVDDACASRSRTPSTPTWSTATTATSWTPSCCGGATTTATSSTRLVDSLTDLVGGGVIWLLTPKVGRPSAVDPADVSEAAPVAGLSTTTTAPVSRDWSATRLVAPKPPRPTPARPSTDVNSCYISTCPAGGDPCPRRELDGQAPTMLRVLGSRRRPAPLPAAQAGPARRDAARWGTGPAGGFTAMAILHPDRLGPRRRAR